MSIYKTIDNEENMITTWPLPVGPMTYRDVGEEYGYYQGYTKVDVEIPDAHDGISVLPGYWTTGEVMKTTFSICRMFRTAVAYMPASLIVHLDDDIIAVDYTGERLFTVPVGYDDGYLWVEYIPAAIADMAGNTVSLFREKHVLAVYITPVIDAGLLIRIRRVCNAIENFLGMAVTSWVGGTHNMIYADAGNIIPGYTPCSITHVCELTSVISALESRLDELIPVVVSHYIFSQISDSDCFMIQYIEELMEALNRIELSIIEYISD